MADEKPVVAAPVETKVETKTADKPVETAAKATFETKPVVETKPEVAKDAKPETEVKPAEELKTLLDEASEEEVKLDKDGKPIVAEAKVVPEKYELKAPEGMTLDAAQLAVAEPIFKALGLDNEGAQKLIDLQAQLNKANEDAHVNQFNQYVSDLKKESKEYFGTKLPEVMRNMARARDMFLPKSADGKEHPLLEKLNISGLANDKHVIEFFDKIGRTIGEGKFVEGKRSAPVKGAAGQTQEQVQESVSLEKVYDKSYAQK